MTKKILYISGTRADYGLMRSALEAIDQSTGLDLEIVATGMHLMPEFGNTVKEIQADGFKLHKIPVVYEEDTRAAMSVFIGKFITLLTKKVAEIKPDLILLLGDRGEVLAGAIVGNYLGIPVVHVHGGEITSTVDEPVRHAITKLAHIHLTATKKSARRIIRMGEDPACVYAVGAPGLDSILKGRYTSHEILYKKYHLVPSEPILLVVQHPVSDEIPDSARNIKTTLDAVTELGYQTIVVYPNADTGGRMMIPVIEEYCRLPFFQAYKNIPHDDYLGLLSIASVLIGNSSSGIIEAPSFHLPVINIGTRQQGRERAVNIIDTRYNKYEIRDSIIEALQDKPFLNRVRRCNNPYGQGNSSEKIVTVLSNLKLNKIKIQKKNFY
jgi:UDP-hydrolysing UDP-N-acetyl-D-glucosamine 2-epimerase